VVFLDLRRPICLWRVLWRLVRDRRRTRPDLPEGCGEGFDLELLRWIWRYPRDDRPRVLALLARLDGRADVRHLRSRADVRRYLDTV
jgi:adenylate kinase family enzyme